MERSQFTFYISFAKAAERIKKVADRCAFYDTIKDYALYGKEPDMDQLPDAVAVAFELVRPNLDSSKRKSEAGKSGGRSRKQTESKPEARGSKPEANESKPEARGSRKQGETESEKEREKEKEVEKEKEIENECLYKNILPPDGGSTKKQEPPAPTEKQEDPAALVLQDYLNRINPAASPASLDELRGFAQVLGAAVCQRAFDIALDEHKAQWSYIKAILRAKQQQGVRSLADWDRLEQQRQKVREPQHSLPPEEQDISWMAEVIRKRKGGGTCPE